MLKRHQTRRQLPRRTIADAYATAPTALDLRCGLGLPKFPGNIPMRWEHTTGDEEILDIARHLVDAGLFSDRHAPTGNVSLKDAIESVLSEFATMARPRPLSTDLGVVIAGDLSGLEVDYGRYAKDHGTLNPATCKALIISFNYENGMHCEVIGPVLKTIEAAWPRLGQTLLDTLERGFMRGVRCLSAGQGLDWASHQYWSGGNSEIDHMKETIHGEGHADWKAVEKWSDEKVRDAYAKQGYECFQLADYEKYFPRIWHRDNNPFKHLPTRLDQPSSPMWKNYTLADTFAMQSFREEWPAILALCHRIRELIKVDTRIDNGYCENGTWDNCPFMLRFDDDDCLPQIADDVWQIAYESGEHEMAANSIFLWHDAPSLIAAINRMRNQLELSQACEDLLRLLKPEQHRIKIKV